MASDIAIAAQEILKTRATLNQLYTQHCKQELSKVEAVMDRDTWFSGLRRGRGGWRTGAEGSGDWMLKINSLVLKLMLLPWDLTLFQVHRS